MSRYIDADKLHEHITTNHCGECGIYNGEICCSCPMDKALNYIEDFPTADVAPRAEWISVEERLPDLYGTYLVRTFHNLIKLGCFCEWIIGEDPGFDDYAVTHWMPLPEPPKGD